MQDMRYTVTEIETRQDENDGRGSDEYETMVGKANPSIEMLATSIRVHMSVRGQAREEKTQISKIE